MATNPRMKQGASSRARGGDSVPYRLTRNVRGIGKRGDIVVRQRSGRWILTRVVQAPPHAAVALKPYVSRLRYRPDDGGLVDELWQTSDVRCPNCRNSRTWTPAPPVGDAIYACTRCGCSFVADPQLAALSSALRAALQKAERGAPALVPVRS